MTQDYISVSSIDQLVISSEWGQYRQFLDVMAGKLADFTQDWREELNEKFQQLQEHQKDELYDFYFNDLHEMQQHETLLMNSFFVASFSLLELQLKRFCDNAQRRLNNRFSASDLRGSITDRAKSYATKLGVPFPTNTPEWQEIRKYQDIRNEITHAGGYVAPAWRRFSFVKTKKLVDTSECEHRQLYQLKLTKEFCDEALDNFEQFMLEASRAAARWTP